jgi:hypothetical protein
LYTGGGVGALSAAAGFPSVSASSSVGGISGSLGVLRPLANGPDVCEEPARGGSELPTSSSIGC